MFRRNFAVPPAGFRLAFAAVVAASVVACTAVGPDFRRPDPQSVPPAHPYTPDPMPAQTTSAPGVGGAVQRFEYDQDIPAQWWMLFQSEPLNALIRAALANNPTLVAAEATMRQAQENYNAEYGSKALPSVNGQLGVTRERGVQFGPPSIFTLYNANVAVSYAPDVFGGVRRDLEAFAATIEYQRLQLEAAHLALLRTSSRPRSRKRRCAPS